LPACRREGSPGVTSSDSTGGAPAPPSSDPVPPSSNPSAWPRPLWLVLIASTALRLWLALGDHGVYWPDEIYQTLEQAHRVAFGSGMIPWEFRDGARSWLLPGAIAGLWRVAAALGVQSSLALVVLARLCMVLASGASVWLAARIAERIAGARAGCVAAVVLAVLPVSVVLGYRVLSETASAPLIALCALCLLQRSPRTAGIAGGAVALASWVRYQNGLFALAFAVWLGVGRRWRELFWFVAAGGAVALAGAALDWATWGRPFHSLLTYLEFNLLEGGASTFGATGGGPRAVQPLWFYAQTLWDSTGPALLVFGCCALWGVRAAPALGLAVLAYSVAHALIPHKELRLLVPALPLVAALAGVGAARLHRRSGAGRVLWWVGLVAATAGAAFNLTRLTHARMGQYLDTPRAARSVWHSDEDANLLLAAAGREPDLCGLGVLGLRDIWTGGYTYFHRAVPLIYANGLCDAEAAVNYVLVPAALAGELVPGDYTLDRQQGTLSLYRRPGACSPPSPGATRSPLEEAGDMGLRRTPAAQAPDGSFVFDPKRHSAAFASGWAPGEVIDCRPGRWAVGRRAVVQFRASAVGPAYMLHAELESVPFSSHQRLTLSLDGRALFDGELPDSGRISADVPSDALRPGDNQLLFEFTETRRLGGDDNRDLAALLRSLELRPLTPDFDIDVGSARDAGHLASGFSHGEVAGDVSFAWSDGPASLVEGTVVDPGGPQVLEIRARAIAGTTGRARVFINEHALAGVRFTPEWSTRQLFVTPGLLRRGLNQLRFEYVDSVTPAALDPGSADERRLSIGFDRIRLEPLPPVTALDMGSPEARAALLEGWSADETEAGRTVVWSVGPRARLRASLLGAQRLELEARAYGPAMPVQVDVVVDGQRVGSFQPTDSWSRQSVPLVPLLVSEHPSSIELRFDHTARPARHEPGSSDERELALRVARLEIVR
ncbi:MAG TPA: glycosyltransferase family 39 protein, partial [Polyangiaceae bacterium]|nr:glycosyltransferase family 39 protein [Polyangiaceae bacterium]